MPPKRGNKKNEKMLQFENYISNLNDRIDKLSHHRDSLKELYDNEMYYNGKDGNEACESRKFLWGSINNLDKSIGELVEILNDAEGSL